MIIVDMSGGNLCKNDKAIIKRMIDSLAEVDENRQLVLKWQLFQKASPNIPLNHESFEYAYNYGRDKGFKVTASIFDMYSLEFLLKFEVPIIKIANRPELHWLIGEIPRKTKVVVSNYFDFKYRENVHSLRCVSKYPATIEDYENSDQFLKDEMSIGLSDHTSDFQLFYKYKPLVYEAHFCEYHDKNNPDANVFSRTPEQWKEFLGKINEKR